jgi:hypothetical protein
MAFRLTASLDNRRAEPYGPVECRRGLLERTRATLMRRTPGSDRTLIRLVVPADVATDPRGGSQPPLPGALWAFFDGQPPFQVPSCPVQDRFLHEEDLTGSNERRPGAFAPGDRGNLTSASFRIHDNTPKYLVRVSTLP